MKKLLKKISIILMAMIITTGMISVPAAAAETATISISSPTVNVGTEASVVVSISSSGGVLGTELWLTYDTKILELIPDDDMVYGGGGNVRILTDGKTTSFTIKFKTLSPGSSSISVNASKSTIGSSTIAAPAIPTMTINPGSGGLVTVSVPATNNSPGAVTYSSNNNLSSLAISPGAISPAFSSNVTSYTATVGSDCAALIVSAITEDSTATVSVSGKTMDPGINTTKIIVKAQNGATKTYVITTTKEAGATPSQGNNVATEAQTTAAVVPVTTTFNGASYNVISNFTNHALPSGYTAATFDFNGQSVTVGKGSNNLIIMYLEKADGSGNGNFYVYDTASKTFSLLSTVTQPVLTYTILPITSTMEIPDNYTKSTLTINGNDVDVLIPSGLNINYCLFYGVDSAGKAGWYCFDYAEQTVQKYYGGDLMSVVADSSNVNASGGNVKVWKIISAAASVAAIILLLIMIVLAFKLKSKESDDDYDDDEDDDGDDIFSTIAYNELHNNDDEEDYVDINSAKENSSVKDSDIQESNIDETENKVAHNSEIASEIGATAMAAATAATLEVELEDDKLEDDKLELPTKELIDDNDQDNDISDMKDILDDDDDDDLVSSNDDDDDFEFLDIEDLDEK